MDNRRRIILTIVFFSLAGCVEQPTSTDLNFCELAKGKTGNVGDTVVVKGADKKLITDARIFDLFEGPSVGEGKKSLAIEVTLQPIDATLTEEDLKALSDKVVANAAKLGAELRG